MPSDPTLTRDVLTIDEVDVSDTEAMTAWATAATSVFLQPRPTAEAIAERQRRMRDHRLYAARDGDRTVATFRSFDSDVTLPGDVDPLRVNAISSVAVLPTHRRRGLLTTWMTGELNRARDSGDAASILIASEAPIYGRFGFGVSATACTWTLDARASWLWLKSGSIQIVTAEEFADVAEGVYRRARRRHPGTIDRPASRWQLISQLEPGPDPEDRRRQFAVHRGRSGAVDGVLVYKVDDSYTDRIAAATLHVLDLWAEDDAAYADLWRFCTEVDFVTRVVAEDRSPGEPLPLLLADPRAARNGPVSDFLWARLHDVPAAFSARRYHAPGRLTLDVHDLLGQVGDTYLLEVDDDGTGRCERRAIGANEPDIRLDAAALAALWLGSGDTGAMARAGRLVPRDGAALGRAHAVLGWPDAAWCGTWF